MKQRIKCILNSHNGTYYQRIIRLLQSSGCLLIFSKTKKKITFFYIKKTIILVITQIFHKWNYNSYYGHSILNPLFSTAPSPPTDLPLASPQVGCFTPQWNKAYDPLLPFDIIRKSLRRRNCVFVSDASARRWYSDGKIGAAYRFYK